MKSQWKTTVSSVFLSAALLASAVPALAAEPGKPAPAQASASAPTAYKLTNDLQVEMKSVLNEKTADGTRLGAVVRMKNTSSKVVRVPEYEVRMKTKDGVELRLQASLGSPRSIQPKSQVELSYLATVDSGEGVELSELRWVDIDVYVYPKKETLQLSVPVSDLVWNGTETSEIPSASVKKWGEAFTIPSLQTPLEFKTTSISRDTVGTKTNSVVQMLVTNPSTKRQALPNIALEGKSGLQTYDSNPSDATLTLEPGEKKYIHFVIPTELNTELQSLNVVTAEKYIDAQEKPVMYSVGRVHIMLPAKQADALPVQGVYAFGASMKMDPLNETIHPNLDVSLVELHMQQNDEDGFKTAIAKFKLTNKSGNPLDVPGFATDLVSRDGYTYNGNRQEKTSQRVLPNASHVVTYSYVLPASETGEGLKMALYETYGLFAAEAASPAPATPVASYKSLLTAYSVNLQPQPESKDELKLYPLTVKVNNWEISAMFNQQQNYNYRLKLSLDIEQEKDVLIDRTFSQLQFDLYDNGGTLINSVKSPFVGENKLQKGSNTINFGAESMQLDYPVMIKVYESFVNDKGETAKRLLTTFKQ
ncbi:MULTISPECIES: hypothetical protein [unclassified Paenibacillus]|uniref:hypothetical protein n=1 Tax=unclassified Paenibacillus TaxID=185978 RepID=UPI00020D79E5|nr:MULTISPECIES: hypothetical protein [unclassified Paenibacillus]EGL19817.1 hypothetical protein HMPREF9413_3578 [Paenibacillus sp. HGF7]EPD92243.1 hypothetical protein HMPREF1207_00913 [Paenibacillus sp. HGH0039]